MNDLLRFISNSLKPFGYHVRKYKAPNILKISNLENAEHEQNIKAFRRNIDKGLETEHSNLDQMIVYVRTCVRENRNIDPKPRVTGTDMKENTLRCLRSLVRAVNHACQHKANIQLIILDDRSDSGPLEEIKNVLSELQCDFELRQTKQAGQGNSLHEQFSDSKAHNAIIYFCEDDYLHELDAILTCWRFYKHVAETLGTHCMIYPQEHAVLYDNLYPSYIIDGPDRHWRTMRHATHTFITHSHVVDKYWDYFENTKYVGVRKKRKKGSEARTTNKLFKHIPGFSPLRPAAVHLQFDETLPPLYDWRPLWEKNAA